MVPLQVVLAAERSLTAGLTTGEVAFALVDALDVGVEVEPPNKCCEKNIRYFRWSMMLYNAYRHRIPRTSKKTTS